MTASAHEPLELSRQAILDAGWRQGSLLPADAGLEFGAWAHPRTQGLTRARKHVAHLTRQEGAPDRPVSFPRPLREGDRAIVLSHTCDLVKAPDQFPLVELGLVVETKSQLVIDAARSFGSATYYELGPAAAGATHVLDHRWRTQIDKGFLVEIEPDNGIVGGWSAAEGERFGRWLGRRYGRPVLDDEDVDEVLEPVRQRWKRLIAEEPDLARSLSREFIEMRFRRIEGGVEVFVLSPGEAPDESLALEAFGVLVEALEPHHGEVVSRSDRIAYATFTRQDDLTTESIDLEWVSDDETGDPVPPL